MDWDSARHPGNVTENGAAMCDAVIYDRRENSLLCNFDITHMLLPSDAQKLTLT